MRPSICTLGRIVVIALGAIYMTLGMIGMSLDYAACRGIDSLNVLMFAFWLILFMGGCAAFFTEIYRGILRARTRGSTRRLGPIFD